MQHAGPLGAADKAVAEHRQALEVRTEAGHRWGVAKSAYDLGGLLCATGDRTGGVALLRRALRDFEAIGDPLAPDVRDRLAAAGTDPA